ncbi:hypothetical protein [Limnohabitans lacus]|jgi:hypothetical protein|uniref:Uncharacterized protein n=1 Tax=Limnohabitans lacus TaxID=3045173 RepID=A0ABT6X5U7_9BURK|nr:hypothetical protein [Limnohabitans sp. HM2-2]MDI9233486.1 hypothetical protein [Limnohabitans sp. HM2-2]
MNTTDDSFDSPFDGLFDGPSGLLRQSYAGAVRQRLLEIERAVQSGQRHEVIMLRMQQAGMSASMGTFRKSLSRARIWWRRQLFIQMDGKAVWCPAKVQSSALPDHPSKTQPETGLSGPSPLPAAHQLTVTSASPDLRKPQPQPATDAIDAARAQAPRTKSAPDARRADLDQFFKPKSVFAKT